MDSDRADLAFQAARVGDRNAFAEWMSYAEIPLLRSLRRHARTVDVEVVMQETFLRMWLVALDRSRPIEGPDAALRFAFGVARNVILEELRRYPPDRFVELDVLVGLPEGCYEDNLPDPALAGKLRDCLERIPSKPRAALSARLRDAFRPDRELAAGLRMNINTFFQNIVRARRFLRDCLERGGVRLAEILS
jgi:DNA-directed RNA polymerase specialized sigma24 family protein